MTKKSAGRLMRDFTKKKTQETTEIPCWDELNAIHRKCVEMLIQHGSVGRFIKDADLAPHIKDHKSFIININSLANDLKSLQEELRQINALHLNKTGGTSDPDVLISTYEINEHYTKFLARVEGTITPTYQYILEQAHEAELIVQALAAAQAPVQRDLTNPALRQDVTDVKINDAMPTTETVVRNTDEVQPIPAEQ